MSKRITLLFLVGLLCLNLNLAARTLQQPGDSGSSSPPAEDTYEDTTALDTDARGADLEDNGDEKNVFLVLTIRPWSLGQNYSRLYPGPDGLVVPVGAVLAWTWGNATHGVYRIPSEECPRTFTDGLNGMEAIQEPVNGLSISGRTITVTYVVEQAGVYYFACPVGGGQHCRRGMKLKVTAVDK
ncbi:hypothetical protein Ndes2526B_g05912 [Nannochloris sp. 'desiccata']|nr:hypothetical protein KSW81_007723 [Chlorella desiccata (nom. nud.)]KAH7618967.1 hypothetical protein NADE_005815 [Chlorella desiccata (nom. nud.)]